MIVSKLVGIVVVGAVMVVAAVYSVAFLDLHEEPEIPEPLVRPLKTIVVGQPFSAAGRKYPGKVRAAQEVQLAFQVGGQLKEFPVKKGDDALEGLLLARLDVCDFEEGSAGKQ